ncbi:MAG: hypothetical protein AB7L92_01335 [Alphaproteobacteria bacterium]
MSFERSKGITFSALLHLLVLAFAIWGLPELFDRRPLDEPAAMTVEVVPISSISNIPKSEKKPLKNEDKQAPEKEQKKPSPPVNKEEPKPAPPPPPEEKKEEKKKPEVKKEEKKEPEKKPKEEDLSAVLKAVKDTARKEQEKNKKTPDKESSTKSISELYDPTKPLSLSEIDAIKSQIEACWSPPIGAKEAENLKFSVLIQIELSGEVSKVELVTEESRYNSDSFFRAAVDSAVRAVKMCSPLKNLPQDKYSRWKITKLNFDPRDMLN